MRRPDLQLVTYRLTPNAPVEKLCQGRMLLNLRKKPEVEEVFWGRWTEDESCLDILIKWEGDFSAEKTLRYLSPLNAYLRADCLPLSVTFETYGDLRVLATHGDIAYLTITTFRIPASVYAADLEIDRRIGEVVRSLVFGAPRHGSNWIPPPEDEIPLDYRIGAATRDWTGALVHSEPSPSSSKEKSSNISADKRWVAFVQWKRPHLETEFKMRGGRHFFIKLAKLKGIRGLDGEDPSENAEILAEKDPALATKGFWRPITETWDATLEEHHVAFHQIDKYCMDSNIWFHCTIQ